MLKKVYILCGMLCLLACNSFAMMKDDGIISALESFSSSRNKGDKNFKKMVTNHVKHLKRLSEKTNYDREDYLLFLLASFAWNSQNTAPDKLIIAGNEEVLFKDIENMESPMKNHISDIYLDISAVSQDIKQLKLDSFDDFIIKFKLAMDPYFWHPLTDMVNELREASKTAEEMMETFFKEDSEESSSDDSDE